MNVIIDLSQKYVPETSRTSPCKLEATLNPFRYPKIKKKKKHNSRIILKLKKKHPHTHYKCVSMCVYFKD